MDPLARYAVVDARPSGHADHDLRRSHAFGPAQLRGRLICCSRWSRPHRRSSATSVRSPRERLATAGWRRSVRGDASSSGRAVAQLEHDCYDLAQSRPGGAVARSKVKSLVSRRTLAITLAAVSAVADVIALVVAFTAPDVQVSVIAFLVVALTAVIVLGVGAVVVLRRVDESRIRDLEERTRNAEARADTSEQRAQEAEASAGASERRAVEAEARAETSDRHAREARALAGTYQHLARSEVQYRQATSELIRAAPGGCTSVAEARSRVLQELRESVFQLTHNTDIGDVFVFLIGSRGHTRATKGRVVEAIGSRESTAAFERACRIASETAVNVANRADAAFACWDIENDPIPAWVWEEHNPQGAFSPTALSGVCRRQSKLAPFRLALRQTIRPSLWSMSSTPSRSFSGPSRQLSRPG